MISTPCTPLRRAAIGRAWLLPLAALLLGGCATRTQSTDSFLGLITPYRIDIVQGNAVTKEQVAAIKPGMSRDQVTAILGTPMLADPFHANRWDYLFSIRRPGTEPQRRSVVAHFDGKTLVRLEAPDDLPSENEFVASIVPVKRVTAPPVLELTEEQRKALPVPARKDEPAAAAAAAAPLRSFPPLEPK
jgi:outer membrane protein assembly factor BamE